MTETVFTYSTDCHAHKCTTSAGGGSHGSKTPETHTVGVMRGVRDGFSGRGFVRCTHFVKKKNNKDNGRFSIVLMKSKNNVGGARFLHSGAKGVCNFCFQPARFMASLTPPPPTPLSATPNSCCPPTPPPPSVFWPSSCDLLRRAVRRRRRKLPARSDLSSLHYHPNTPPAHIVLQGPEQIAIFMGHDKGNAALCSHFLLPGAGTGGAVIHGAGRIRRWLFVVCCQDGRTDGWTGEK